jgi:hypothetical protein
LGFARSHQVAMVNGVERATHNPYSGATCWTHRVLVVTSVRVVSAT